MKYFRILAITLLFAANLLGQGEDGSPILTEFDFPGINILRTEYYDGNSLWGLIDGGADIYLEYGFEELAFQIVEWEGFNFRVELFRMIDGNSAFGIYSVSRYKCMMNDTLTNIICITQYQVQAAIGKYYISVANDKGTDEARNLTIDIFSKIISKLHQNIFTIPQFFEQERFSPYKDRFMFIKGKLGLQNGFPMWSEMFDKYSGYEVFLLPIVEDDYYAYISLIQFSSEKETDEFVGEHSTATDEGIHNKIERLSPVEIVFIESNRSE
ncbi:MAG: hypothetical protein A2V66_09630 [Ignavibacteria bacterium RBG_13_36_8]|nr:MAG: hypothetical protein A2V66_09630 [Ignavibacteria bacterium RBG_13_36_8]